MRRRAVPHERISLFPFLAVLICTMGSLLVLLVVIAQRAQATAKAEQVARQSSAREVNEVTKQELESLQSEITQLQTLRDQTAESLADGRNVLAHVEDHMRRLGEQLQQIQAAAAAMDAAASSASSDPDRLRAELQRIRQQVGESKQLLQTMLASVAGQPKSYAVVPYQGTNGTTRRPIYLECRSDSVVIQPEGVVLEERDFAQPLGPENPLAAALRAYSNFLLRNMPSDQVTTIHPYPLLLVRPSGISAYYAARGAMKSWDTEFGYELVGEDWKLEFPAADPRLAQIVQQAVEIARPRHRFMVSQYRQSQRQTTARNAGQPGFGRLVDAGAGDTRPNAFGAPPSAATGNGNEARPSRRAEAGSQSPAAGQTRQPLPAGAETEGNPLRSANTAQASIADSRGRDWALPNASNGSVPFTRPMRVECAAEQLVIMPRSLHDRPQAIPFNGATEDAIETIVSAVWEHMHGWGIAGRGMYWKPVLNLYVQPGGETRARELETLLDRSGLEIQRR